MLALTFATLFTKNIRKVLQSLSEETAAGGRGGLTIVFMVLNSTLGLCLLDEMRLAKYAALALLTDEFNCIVSSLT